MYLNKLHFTGRFDGSIVCNWSRVLKQEFLCNRLYWNYDIHTGSWILFYVSFHKLSLGLSTVSVSFILSLCIFPALRWVCGKVGMGCRNQWHKRKHSPPPRHKKPSSWKICIFYVFKELYSEKTVQITFWNFTLLERYIWFNLENLIITIWALPTWIKVKSCPKADNL